MEALFKNLKQSGLRIVSASNTYAPNWDVCFDKADMKNKNKWKLLLDLIMVISFITMYKKNVISLTYHVPVAYILGHQEFYGLDFLVDRRVLIPRSDTETIIDTVKRETTSSPSLRLLDVCTGSGCIGITLSRLLGCPVTLADISNDALDVAGENARRLLSTPFTIIQSDLFSNIHANADRLMQ